MIESLPFTQHNKQGIEQFLSVHALSIIGSASRAGPAGEDKHADMSAVRKTAENPFGEVVELTDANYKEKLSQGTWFVDFFAPWCPHCVHLKPVWDELGKKSQNIMNIATIDCTQNGEACNAYGIRGFPTLKLFKNGVPADYWGSREIDGLSRFVAQNSQ